MIQIPSRDRHPIRAALFAGLFAALCSAPVPAWSQASPIPPMPATPRIPVFTILFEAKASESDGTSASSHVEVTFGPGPIWHGSFGVYAPSYTPLKAGEDSRTPAALYKLRGGLAGLRPGEPMCFGILSHKGTASAGGRTLTGPGSIQQSSSGVNWTLREDAARFTRTEDGGVLRLAPVVYQDEDPPEFALLGPGAYDFGSAGDEAYERFMTFRLTNRELANLRSVRKVNEASLTSKDGSIRQWWKATLTAAPPEDETEVVGDPEDGFDRWIPKGNLDKPGEPGERIRIHLQGRKKGEPGVPRRATFVLKLLDVSMEKGVCLNWPLSGAKSDHGLRILAGENPDLEVLGPDEARTKEPVDSLDLVVTCHDYGAYGKLHVTAKDLDGSEVKVTLRGKEDADLAIPLDENRNHVADAWEVGETGHLRGAAAEDEEDLPKGKPGCTGDGLSLYEEYRGFRVKGVHRRGDPDRKDLFVCDRTAGKVAGPGIDRFSAATWLTVHRLDKEELGEDRVINPNGGSAHLHAQHGLLVVDGAAGSDPEQIPADPKSTTFGPPVLTKHVKLPPGRSFEAGDGASDVAHELGHAVGLQHHGDENLLAVEWFWQLDGEAGWQLHEQEMEFKDVQTSRTKSIGQWAPKPGSPGRVIQAFWEPSASGGAPRPFCREDGAPAGSLTVGVERWRLYVGGERSQFSGDQECLMRYADKQAYQSKAEPGRVRYLPDKAQWKERTRLCEDARGTGVNAPGHAPQPRYGDAVAGKCRQQIVVNDKYAN